MPTILFWAEKRPTATLSNCKVWLMVFLISISYSIGYFDHLKSLCEVVYKSE